jgi:hypothetical protein
MVDVKRSQGRKFDGAAILGHPSRNDSFFVGGACRYAEACRAGNQSPGTLKLGNRGQHSQGSGSAILVRRRHLSDYEKSLVSLSTRAAFRRFVRRSKKVLMLERTDPAFCIARVCRNASYLLSMDKS